MSKRRKKRKGRALARRFGRARARKGRFNMPGETGVPVRVHGTLFVSPHADERIVETIAEVVEDIAPAIVEEAIAEAAPEIAEEVIEAIPPTLDEERLTQMGIGGGE